MLNVFIDTNVFLNFYSFTSEHLNKLKSLVDLIKSKNIQLLLTEQVVDEFNRNRETKLSEALRYIEDLVPNVGGSLSTHDIDEIKDIKRHVEELNKISKKLHKKMKEQIKNQSLPADKLIYEIFEITDVIPVSIDILNKAKIRFDRGNPPGKRGSYGDVINWELLFATLPDKSDLYFIGGDKDYKSVIEPSEFSPFLKKEWKKKKNGVIYYHELVSSFIKDKFPNIKITNEDVEEEKFISIESNLFKSYQEEQREKMLKAYRNRIEHFYKPYQQEIINKPIIDQQDRYKRFLKPLIDQQEQQNKILKSLTAYQESQKRLLKPIIENQEALKRLQKLSPSYKLLEQIKKKKSSENTKDK